MMKPIIPPAPGRTVQFWDRHVLIDIQPFETEEEAAHAAVLWEATAESHWAELVESE